MGKPHQGVFKVRRAWSGSKGRGGAIISLSSDVRFKAGFLVDVEFTQESPEHGVIILRKIKDAKVIP